MKFVDDDDDDDDDSEKSRLLVGIGDFENDWPKRWKNWP